MSHVSHWSWAWSASISHKPRKSIGRNLVWWAAWYSSWCPSAISLWAPYWCRNLALISPGSQTKDGSEARLPTSPRSRETAWSGWHRSALQKSFISVWVASWLVYFTTELAYFRNLSANSRQFSLLYFSWRPRSCPIRRYSVGSEFAWCGSTYQPFPSIVVVTLPCLQFSRNADCSWASVVRIAVKCLFTGFAGD